jgi:hypothetical protein
MSRIFVCAMRAAMATFTTLGWLSVTHAQTLVTISGSGVSGLGDAQTFNTHATFTGVGGILRTPWDGFFVTEFSSNRLRWIGDDGYTATTIGNGKGFAGDGGPVGQAKTRRAHCRYSRSG